MTIEAGYLIVKTFERLYCDYAPRYKLTKDFYGLPRIDRTPKSFPIQYRGLDREALGPYTNSDDLAEIRMAELEKTGECEDGFLFTDETLRDVLSLAQSPFDYEVIWAKIASSPIQAPAGFVSVGFDPTYFDSDHFSASCDCMLIPRWHGTDKEGTRFLEYFCQLNRFGLFSSPDASQAFLDFYLSLDWTETGEYATAEVFLKDSGAPSPTPNGSLAVVSPSSEA
jgi:hypothetical protein